MAPQLWVPVHGEGTLTREWQSLPAHTHPIQERILARGEYSLAFPPNRTNEGPQGHSLGKPQIRQVCEKSFFPLETMMLHVLNNMPFSEGILHSLTFSKKAHCPTQTSIPSPSKSCSLLRDQVYSPPSTSFRISALLSAGVQGQGLCIGCGDPGMFLGDKGGWSIGHHASLA